MLDYVYTPENTAGANPNRLRSDQMAYTLVHEYTHNFVKGHGEDFTMKENQFLTRLGSKKLNVLSDEFFGILEKRGAEYAAIQTKLKEVYDGLASRGEIISEDASKIRGAAEGRELTESERSFAEEHRQAVKEAVLNGEKVPEAVLKDYPELKELWTKAERKARIVKNVTTNLRQKLGKEPTAEQISNDVGRIEQRDIARSALLKEAEGIRTFKIDLKHAEDYLELTENNLAEQKAVGVKGDDLKPYLSEVEIAKKELSDVRAKEPDNLQLSTYSKDLKSTLTKMLDNKEITQDVYDAAIKDAERADTRGKENRKSSLRYLLTRQNELK